jgi:hypothetical protein
MKLKRWINIKKELQLKESSLSRIWKHVSEHDSGTISAFRYASDCGTGQVYTRKENEDRNAKLKAQLLSLGYGVTAIDGVYIENYKSSEAREVKEDSFIVIDLKNKGNLKKDLMKLGEQYEQDSITYSKASGEYYLIGTNKCPNGYPGYKKENKLGKSFFGQDGEFHSKINGRPFVFKECIQNRIDLLTNYSISEIRSIKHLAEQANNEIKVCKL